MNVVLLRVSSNKQDTLVQRKAIEEYAKQNKIIIDKVVEEYAVSGFKTPMAERQGLNEIKQLAINGMMDSLLVYNTDRIGRRIELISFISLLTECNVIIHSATEGIINENKDYSDLLNSIKLFMASNESKKTSQRIKSAKKVGYESGEYQGGRYVNYGYNVSNGKLVINEKEAEIIKKIYSMYISYGTKYVLNYLYENNITRRGYRWTANSLIQTIKNPLYYGQKLSKHNTPYDKTLAIISYDIWNKAQVLLAERRTRETVNHSNKSSALLESLVYHKVDDTLHKCYVDYSYNGKYKHLIYRCPKCKINKDRPKDVKYNFSGNKLHRIIENEIKVVLNNLDTDKLEMEYIRRKALELTIIQTKIDDLSNTLELKKKALRGASETLENIFNGTLDLDIKIINDKIKGLQGDIITIETELNEFKDKLKTKELEQTKKYTLKEKYKDFGYIYDIASDEKKKAILNELVDKIVIDNNDIEIKLNL